VDKNNTKKKEKERKGEMEGQIKNKEFPKKSKSTGHEQTCTNI
jgi:hypothetical protein